MGSHEPMSLQLPNIYGGLRQYNPLSGVINGHREEAQTTSAPILRLFRAGGAAWGVPGDWTNKTPGI